MALDARLPAVPTDVVDRSESPRSDPGAGLARHAVAEVDDSRAEGAGLDEFEIHPALALGKERNATANQHRVDHNPVLVDKTQCRHLGSESGTADRDVALPGSARSRSISSARPPEARRALPCTAESVVENTTFGSGFQIAAHSSSASLSD